MFIFYCLVLLLLVYLGPAIALYPRLILSSRTAVAIPYVSIAVIILIQEMLQRTGMFSHEIVLAVSASLFFIAAIRAILLLRRIGASSIRWPPTHRVLILLSLLLGLYWATRLGTAGFDTDDEIYSWNMWAVQHYLGHEIDYYYTQSAYPQLFSILISYCYKLLGSFELQLPVKLLFALFPISLWSAIAIAPREATFANAIRSVVVMVLLTAAIGRYFSIGLADPLMAASLTVSIFAFIEYSTHPDRREFLFLSLVCAAVSLYTKQAALIWALFSLPLVALIATLRGRLLPITLIGAGVVLALGLAWVIGAGSGFQDNYGVINASQQGRELTDQLLWAVRTHTFDHPFAPLFLIAAGVSVIRGGRHRDIFLLFVLPSLLAWLLFGAYSMRLGIHIVAVCALLLAATDYSLSPRFGSAQFANSEQYIRRNGKVLAILALILISSLSAYRINRHIDDNFSLYISGKNTISRYFGKDAEFVFDELYNRPDLMLWVPSNYIYGIFYGHTPVMRPAFREIDDYDHSSLLSEIRDNRPDYLFDSGPQVAYGPGAMLLHELAEQHCPELFEKRAGPPNELGYTVYALNYDEARIGRCEDNFNEGTVSLD